MKVINKIIISVSLFVMLLLITSNKINTTALTKYTYNIYPCSKQK